MQWRRLERRNDHAPRWVPCEEAAPQHKWQSDSVARLGFSPGRGNVCPCSTRAADTSPLHSIPDAGAARTGHCCGHATEPSRLCRLAGPVCVTCNRSAAPAAQPVHGRGDRCRSERCRERDLAIALADRFGLGRHAPSPCHAHRSGSGGVCSPCRLGGTGAPAFAGVLLGGRLQSDGGVPGARPDAGAIPRS